MKDISGHKGDGAGGCVKDDDAIAIANSRLAIAWSCCYRRSDAQPRGISPIAIDHLRALAVGDVQRRTWSFRHRTIIFQWTDLRLHSPLGQAAGLTMNVTAGENATKSQLF
jgi:hypothetical protein